MNVIRHGFRRMALSATPGGSGRTRPTAWLLACAVAAVLGAAAMGAQEEPISPDEHFKYGSVGIESEEGIPYWIWQVLPRMFPEKLPGPGGYGSLGLMWEPGRELPIGFSKKDVLGSTRIAVNCAFCHTATYRTSPASPRVVVPGGATSIVDAQAFSRFLEAAAADPRFNASDMLAEIGKIGKLSWTESMNYRVLLIPGTRRALRRHKEEFAWMDGRPNWGRGRIDPLNPFKYRQLRQPIDQTIGNSDMTPLWSLGLRDGRALHWDGLNPSFQEVLVSSGIGNGASVKSIDLPSLERVGAWMRELRPPPYPFAIDKTLADRGGAVFDAECSVCHGPAGARMGRVIPVEEVGTDRHRVDTWTAASAAAFNAYAAGQAWQFKQFRKTNGYVAMPLTGAWLNAPYLHNGAVPTLTDLLESADRRPSKFWRGYDVYDPSGVGFVSHGPEAEQHGQAFDTTQPGNANSGHAYGTAMAPDQKQALIEFLKTL